MGQSNILLYTKKEPKVTFYMTIISWNIWNNRLASPENISPPQMKIIATPMIKIKSLGTFTPKTFVWIVQNHTPSMAVISIAGPATAANPTHIENNNTKKKWSKLGRANTRQILKSKTNQFGKK